MQRKGERARARVEVEVKVTLFIASIFGRGTRVTLFRLSTVGNALDNP